MAHMAGPRIFVSYVHENRDIVTRLVNALRDRGYEVWFDQDRLPPGVYWADEIRRAISDHDFFIACFSHEWSAKDRTVMNAELGLAISEMSLRGDSPWFIPVLLSGEIPDRSIGAGRTLRDIQYVKLRAENWASSIDAIVGTVKGRYRSESGVSAVSSPRPNSARRFWLARAFVQSLRNGVRSGPSFETHFDADQMHLARQLLAPDDVPRLLELLADTSMPSGVRNRCASLVLSEACATEGKHTVTTINTLITLYKEASSSLPDNWEVARGIAFALANQVGHSDALLDYLRRIAPDAKLVQLNLEQTNRYYGDSAEAIELLLKRVRNQKVSPSACVWEAFYLTHPSVHLGALRGEVAIALKKKENAVTSPPLAEFWRKRIELLDSGGAA
jgi:hypothetical protein